MYRSDKMAAEQRMQSVHCYSDNCTYICITMVLQQSRFEDHSYIVSRASPYPLHYCCCAMQLRNSCNAKGRGWRERLDHSMEEHLMWPFQ